MAQNKGINNEYTIFADKRTKLRPAVDDNTIPKAMYDSYCSTHRFNFVDFDDIYKYKGFNIDVIGRASAIGDWHKQASNEAAPEKREILLTNDKEQQIGAVSYTSLCK